MSERTDKYNKAEFLLKLFTNGERTSIKETKDAVILILEELEFYRKSASYQTCHTHGAVNATLEWCCPRCYESAIMELERLGLK